MLFAVQMLLATDSQEEFGDSAPWFFCSSSWSSARSTSSTFAPAPSARRPRRLNTRKVELGERAQTIGGFVGTVVKMDDGLITLRGASGVELDFIPTAIARKYDPPAAVPESTDDEHHEEGDSK